MACSTRSDQAAVSYQIVLTKADQVKAAGTRRPRRRDRGGACQAPGRLSRRARHLGAQRRRHCRICAPRSCGSVAERARLTAWRRAAPVRLEERRHARANPAMSSVTSPQEQARILSEALPHMQRYDEEIVVIKYGGHAMGDEQAARELRARHRAARADRDQSGGGARRRAADRGDAQAARHQVANSPAGCASPTPPRWKSSRWCWPARSTSRSSASSTRPAARRSACAARTATWCMARKVEPPRGRSGYQHARRWSTSASSASRKKSTSPCSTRSSAAS